MMTHLRKSFTGAVFTVLTMLLTTTTSWGQVTGTLTITRSDFTAPGAYGTDDPWEVTTSTGHEISGFCDIFGTTTNSMQVNPANTNSTKLMFHNSVVIPGAITKITMTKHSSGTVRAWTPYLSTDTVLTFSNYTDDGDLQATQNVDTTPVVWNIDAEDNYRFFYLAMTAGATNIDSIIIEYEIETSEPTLIATPSSITNLGYVEEGTPTADSFTLSALNWDDVANKGIGLHVGNFVDGVFNYSDDFEISFEEDSNFDDHLELSPFNGDALPVYVRLKAGKAVGSYNATVLIAGADASVDDIEVTLSGEVTEAPEPFGLPYENGLRTQDDVDEAVDYGFEFNGTTLTTSAGGYIAMPINSNIVSPAIDFSQYDAISVSFSVATFGGNSGQELTVFVSENNGDSYTLSGTFDVDTSGTNYLDFTQSIDVSSSVSVQGKIKFEMTGGSNSIRFRDLEMYEAPPLADFIFEDGDWVPPIETADTNSSILVVDGIAVFADNIELGDITVNTGATLQIEAILKSNGNIVNDGSIVFKSTSVANTAQFDEFYGNISGLGSVTVERYIPARRAFRFLSTAVTTTGSIRDNWQEGQNNTTTASNSNTNPGFGTHITGSTTGANGFDATLSGNPSLFTLNNIGQAWITAPNTDTDVLVAGRAYRIMVRGSRAVDLTINEATPDDTVLRSTGTMVVGTVEAEAFNTTIGLYNMFGNPYQAIVDMNSVIAGSDDIDANFYYVWDPTLGVRGAYTTITLPAGTATAGSDANQYLQPGQSALIRTGGPAPILRFNEADKAVNATPTGVFVMPPDNAFVRMDIYNVEAYNTGAKAADGLLVKFSENGTNEVTLADATKFGNLDENIATQNGNAYLAIESRAMPVEEEVIPLFINQYRHTDYVFEVEVANLGEGIEARLRDAYTEEETVLSGTSIVAFSIDSNIPESTASDRFDIYFTQAPMSVEDHFGAGFALYPNPSSGEFFIATKQLEGNDVNVSITNMLGQQVYSQSHKVADNGQVHVQAESLNSGVYVVTLKGANGASYTTRWIKN